MDMTRYVLFFYRFYFILICIKIFTSNFAACFGGFNRAFLFESATMIQIIPWITTYPQPNVCIKLSELYCTFDPKPTIQLTSTEFELFKLLRLVMCYDLICFSSGVIVSYSFILFAVLIHSHSYSFIPIRNLVYKFVKKYDKYTVY